MSIRTYGQFCGLARALEIIGERWSLLIVRDLVLGPKRFTELQAGLPKIPPSTLSARLNELEQSGVLRRRLLPQLDAAVVYELTEYGSELDQIVLDLGLWGARSLGQPSADDVFTLDSAILSLYTTFRSEKAKGVQVTYELRYPGEMILHAIVEDGALKVAEGAHPGADAVIEPLGPFIKDLLTGDLTAADATRTGKIRLEGAFEYLELFAELFHIPAAPKVTEGIVVR
ncbi:helix-turn-helix transcriptional regulator [Amycolatopsis roodepoortensis]|uniref:HxlR family transcriptional regulator n=2 Tax=Amycolatopsis TaxID=1813 RepID=A0A2P2FR15_AMYLU|nr:MULTISPECIES: helix-turn-helix domain-containing protein [Amycolatopsis]RSN26760.1 transcriptional regulator [Streptomyces sp. WAC 05977]KFU79159.1 HxlR family transcriptional regulator [Amycolatopsis lurida NRRL 2430]MBE1579169.1 DNA-binding HxlR family transcriptional regulator/putative sterol carrier protein [Amycolatopsis roodepoortensis]RSN63613.1 transcriptional regulator [Amycolatopsis sp. WAC 04182]UUV34474.1 helix-turn-helix transcriptional regulator [Amycolatopsis roodepoortensis]